MVEWRGKNGSMDLDVLRQQKHAKFKTFKLNTFHWIDTADLFASILAVSFYQSICLCVSLHSTCFLLFLALFVSHRVRYFNWKKKQQQQKHSTTIHRYTRGRVDCTTNWHVMEFLRCCVFFSSTVFNAIECKPIF